MRRISALAVAAAVAVASPVLPAGAATTDGLLRLSTDGSSWAPTLELPLFDGSRVWVPGDQETAAFWVQNDSDDAASLKVQFIGSDGQSLLDVGGVSLSASVDGQRRSIDSSSPSELLTIDRVEANEQRRIELTVTLDPTTGNDAQRASFDVALAVTLTEVVDDAEPLPAAAAPVGPESVAAVPAAREPGPLPRTGLSFGWELTAAALLLVLGGSLLTQRRRGRDAGR